MIFTHPKVFTNVSQPNRTLTKFLSLEASLKTWRMKSYIDLRSRETVSQFSHSYNIMWTLSAKSCPDFCRTEIQNSAKIVPQFLQIVPRFLPNIQTSILRQFSTVILQSISHDCNLVFMRKIEWRFSIQISLNKALTTKGFSNSL